MKPSLRSPYSFALTLPALILYGLLFLVPLTVGQAFAFTNWNAHVASIQFIGLGNFKDMFTEPSIANVAVRCIKNTLYYATMTLVLKNALGLLIALGLNRGLRTQSVLRTVYFIPVVLCPLAVGLMFTAIFNPAHGIVNEALRFIGLSHLARQWTGDPGTAMNVIVFVGVWKEIGLSIVIFLAGLQGVPRDYLEAASIDGAGAAKSFWHIVLPLLMSSMTISLFFSLISGLKVFDLVIAVTKGGPGTMTQVLNTIVYREMGAGRFGMGTALDLLLNLIIAALAIIGLSYLRLKEVEL